ncbi:AAA family ATPase [Candidatus Woesearchaeota archaeon]|nr:AAA family ATPase [Candidatus Woesearchaeota archaeon]
MRARTQVFDSSQETGLRKALEDLKEKSQGENNARYSIVEYIARVVNPSTQLDDVQKILMMYELGTPTILEGPPGTGKTQLIRFIGNLIGQEGGVDEINCNEKMLIEDLLGWPGLKAVKSGESVATETYYEKGKIIDTMEAGRVVYLNEFNKLRHGVQKGLNTILEDNPRYTIPKTKEVVKAKPGFWVVISYNSMISEGREDLERSVADRCNYIPMYDIPEDLLARITLVKAGFLKPEDIVDDDDIELRGVIVKEGEDGKARFEFVYYDQETDTWRYWGVARGSEAKEVSPEDIKNIKPYLTYTGKGNKKLDFENVTNAKEREYLKEVYDLAVKLIKVNKVIRSIVKEGLSALQPNLDKAKQELGLPEGEDFFQSHGFEDFSDLSRANPPGPRAIIYALQMYPVAFKHYFNHVEKTLGKEEEARIAAKKEVLDMYIKNVAKEAGELNVGEEKKYKELVGLLVHELVDPTYLPDVETQESPVTDV